MLSTSTTDDGDHLHFNCVVCHVVPWVVELLVGVRLCISESDCRQHFNYGTRRNVPPTGEVARSGWQRSHPWLVKRRIEEANGFAHDDRLRTNVGGSGERAKWTFEVEKNRTEHPDVIGPNVGRKVIDVPIEQSCA